MPPPAHTLAPPFDASGAPCVTRTAVLPIKRARRVIRDDWHDDRPEVADFITQLCTACPVRRECLAWGLAFEKQNLRFGIYGGTTPEERNGKRRRKPPKLARSNIKARHESGESKPCALCGELFYRRQIESPRQWAVRKFCSRTHAAEYSRSVRKNKGKTP